MTWFKIQMYKMMNGGEFSSHVYALAIHFPKSQTIRVVLNPSRHILCLNHSMSTALYLAFSLNNVS